MSKNTLKNGPDDKGYYGDFGGRYAPEILMPNLIELEKSFNDAINDKKFIDEFEYYLKEWVGRPNPLYFAEKLTKKMGGPKIYFKSDHLNHLGAHKINNALFQILLAKRMGKTKIFCETGAGAHLIATAAACAKFDLPCIGYMGRDDIIKQSTNVLKAKLFGSKVIECLDGTGKKGVLKDACTAVLKAWSSDTDAFYCCGSTIGPHPFPRIVQYAQSVIGKEIKQQILEKEGRLPNAIVACLGGGSNSLGAFHEFLDDQDVQLYGIEAEHSSALTNGTVGIMQGFKSFMLQSESGDATLDTKSLASGINFYSAGSEHAYLKSIGRVNYSYSNDQDSFEAFQLVSKTEGILIAFEPAFAVAYAIKLAKKMKENELLVINICGRGDKDIDTAEKMLGKKLDQ
jgi:tryptophan synthase beta chain